MLKLPSLGELDRRPLRDGLGVSRRHSVWPAIATLCNSTVLIACPHEGLRLGCYLQQRDWTLRCSSSKIV